MILSTRYGQSVPRCSVQLRAEPVSPKQRNPRHLLGDFRCRTRTLLGETRDVDEDPAARPLAGVEPTVECGHGIGALLAGASTTSNVDNLSVGTGASGDDIATPILLSRSYFDPIALRLVEGGDEELKVPPVDGLQDCFGGRRSRRRCTEIELLLPHR